MAWKWPTPNRDHAEVMAAIRNLRDLITRGFSNMATKEQLDKLAADVAALIEAGVAEITAAIAAAQRQSPDPAIDALDSRVTAATKTLTDAAAALASGGATPPPPPPA